MLDIAYVVGEKRDHLTGPHVELNPDMSMSMLFTAVHRAPV